MDIVEMITYLVLVPKCFSFLPVWPSFFSTCLLGQQAPATPPLPLSLELSKLIPASGPVHVLPFFLECSNHGCLRGSPFSSAQMAPPQMAPLPGRHSSGALPTNRDHSSVLVLLQHLPQNEISY